MALSFVTLLTHCTPIQASLLGGGLFNRLQSWRVRMTVLACMGLVGCVPLGGMAEASLEPSVVGATSWIDVDALQDRPPVSLSFKGQSLASGFAGCNRYSSPVDFTPQTLQFKLTISTRMLCEPEAIDTEHRFLSALDQTRSARLNKGVLELLNAQRKVLWRFKPAP